MITPSSSDVDAAAVRDRVAGRKLAAELLALIESEAAALSAAGRLELWATIRARFVAPPQTPAEAAAGWQLPGDIEPMSDEAARSFGARPFPFGKYHGVPIDQIPLSYLVFLVEDSPLKLQIRRYLCSPRIAGELDGTDLLWPE